MTRLIHRKNKIGKVDIVGLIKAAFTTKEHVYIKIKK
jgi:hypothetical protein